MPVYSFGTDSPLKFEISDELAAAYKEGVSNYFAAQRAYKASTGRQWEPDQPLVLNHATAIAFNVFAEFMRIALERYGKPVSMEDIFDDYLVKN